MSRPYEMPDPNDASPNNPGRIIAKEHVIGLYNQANPDDKMQRVTDKVKEWIQKEALNAGWDEAKVIDSQCSVSRTDLPVK